MVKYRNFQPADPVRVPEPEYMIEDLIIQEVPGEGFRCRSFEPRMDVPCSQEVRAELVRLVGEERVSGRVASVPNPELIILGVRIIEVPGRGFYCRDLKGEQLFTCPQDVKYELIRRFGRERVLGGRG